MHFVNCNIHFLLKCKNLMLIDLFLYTEASTELNTELYLNVRLYLD